MVITTRPRKTSWVMLANHVHLSTRVKWRWKYLIKNIRRSKSEEHLESLKILLKKDLKLFEHAAVVVRSFQMNELEILKLLCNWAEELLKTCWWFKFPNNFCVIYRMFFCYWLLRRINFSIWTTYFEDYMANLNIMNFS